jgi:hypothetical protein
MFVRCYFLGVGQLRIPYPLHSAHPGLAIFCIKSCSNRQKSNRAYRIHLALRTAPQYASGKVI